MQQIFTFQLADLVGAFWQGCVSRYVGSETLVQLAALVSP